jgi:hypothetical protein
LDQTSNLIVIADEEKFQNVRILAKQQAQLQSGPAFEDVLSQLPDGNSGVRVGIAETIRNNLKSSFNAGKIRIAQVFERLAEARAEQNSRLRHASVFP